MRPTTSTMLQQNNNNNYPCLNVSGSTREMLQKCSRASLPFPSRLELGLGDLPLIRGLRAWALCSKNRRKAGGMLGGGQAPTSPPAGRGGSTSCPRPADVYLSGEWGRSGYGLPLGLDARQAGIGALVTVATLKTSEGSGKTQTQCLFLRTEKGSCLYSTAKPGSGVTSSAASSVVGGWLRGKTGGGGGGRDIQAGRRDNGPTPQAHTGVNRVRVRSGRRWRKSSNAAAREKTGASRERQRQSAGEDPARGVTLEERQEERDKGGPAGKQPPSPQLDSRGARSPGSCHSASPKTCGRRAQRSESQDEQEGGESSRGGAQNCLSGEVKGMRKEEEKGEELESSDAVLAAPNSDLESNHEEIREAESSEETQTSRDKEDFSERAEDTDSDVMTIHTGSSDLIQSGQVADDVTSRHSREFETPCEEIEANVCDQESEKEMESVDVGKEEGSINPAELSDVSTCPASISAAVPPESSAPAEGSSHATCSREDHLEGCQQGAPDSEIMGKEEEEEEVDVSRFEQQEPNSEENTVNENGKAEVFLQNVENSSEPEEREASSSPVRDGEPSEIEIAERREELVCENSDEVRENHGEAGEICTCNELDAGELKERHSEDTVQEENDAEVMRNCALKDDCRSEESADGCRAQDTEGGDTCGHSSIEANGETGTDVTNVPCADPSTSIALSLANPAPSLPPLGAMATSLEAEKKKEEEEEEEEEEKEGVRVPVEDGKYQEGKSRLGRQLGEEEEERGSTVATEEGRKEEEEEEEEDEFGVFMQAEGEPAWSEGYSMSASVPCGSRGRVALGNHHAAATTTGESTHWTPGWTDGSFHQSDDSWSAFPQDSSDEGRDAAGQWWPTGAAEQSGDRLSANQNLAAVFAGAFPSLPGSSSSDPRDLDTVPTLTQLLRGRAGQDQGLLDSFHDLNKMICQRYKRANGVSRDLLLRTLHLDQPHTESRPAPFTANRRLSPGLPSANQHAQNAAAKRRLSYDYNRNIME